VGHLYVRTADSNSTSKLELGKRSAVHQLKSVILKWGFKKKSGYRLRNAVPSVVDWWSSILLAIVDVIEELASRNSQSAGLMGDLLGSRQQITLTVTELQLNWNS
jgi:hypothetical protein